MLHYMVKHNGAFIGIMKEDLFRASDTGAERREFVALILDENSAGVRLLCGTGRLFSPVHTRGVFLWAHSTRRWTA